MHNRGYLRLLVLIGSVLLAHVGSAMPAQAQNTNRCFPETGYCIGGAIRTYWEQNGGLAVFGLPLGPQQEVIDDAGVRRQAQWFERHRLELHPDKAAPYNVQLGRLGADRLAQQGRDWWNFPRANPNDGNVANCRFFSETSHTVCGPFLEAFRRYGLNFPNTPGVTYAESLALFGLPLSQPMVEIIDGKEYTVQWFERARFELHPENQPPQNVLFGRLGAELNGGRVGNAAALQGKTWELVSYGPLNGTQTAVEGQATLTFNGQQVAGTTGCNNFSGSYSATESAITFGQLVTTLRGCSESLARQETAVLVALSGERPYTINGELLRIVYDDGRQALNYRVAAQNVTALRQNRW
jgi:heat shock protein HslJ